MDAEERAGRGRSLIRSGCVLGVWGAPQGTGEENQSLEGGSPTGNPEDCGHWEEKPCCSCCSLPGLLFPAGIRSRKGRADLPDLQAGSWAADGQGGWVHPSSTFPSGAPHYSAPMRWDSPFRFHPLATVPVPNCSLVPCPALTTTPPTPQEQKLMEALCSAFSDHPVAPPTSEQPTHHHAREPGKIKQHTLTF